MSTKTKTILLSIALALVAAWLWMHRYDYSQNRGSNYITRTNRITGETRLVKMTWDEETTTTTTTQPRRADVDEKGFWIPPSER